MKSNRELKRFTESQKAFLKEKFEVGESSGYKLDPEDVASEMRRVRNAEGKRTSKLISSFSKRSFQLFLQIGFKMEERFQL